MPIRVVKGQGQCVEMVHDETEYNTASSGVALVALYIWGRGRFKVHYQAKSTNAGDTIMTRLADIEANTLESGASESLTTAYKWYSHEFGRRDPGSYIIDILTVTIAGTVKVRRMRLEQLE